KGEQKGKGKRKKELISAVFPFFVLFSFNRSEKGKMMYPLRACGLIATLLSVILAGCGSTSTTGPTNDAVEEPAVTYAGLKGHKAAVMIWADWRTRTEYNQVQIDTARLLTAKLEQRAKVSTEDKKADLAGAQFLRPESVVRYQREHPEVMTLP